MRKWRLILVLLLVVTAGTLSVRGESKRQPLDVIALARESSLTNKVTRAGMASIAGTMISLGQCKKILGRYVGISPRLEAIVTAQVIRCNVSRFDGFSRMPELPIKTEGAPIRSFSARWVQISQTKMEQVQESGVDYLAVTLTKRSEDGSGESVELPLEMQPAGYTKADVALVFGVLANLDLPFVQVFADEEESPIVTNVVASATNVVLRPIQTRVTQPAQPLPRTRRSYETPETRLKQLKELYEKGLLSEEVYLEKQREIMRNF